MLFEDNDFEDLYFLNIASSPKFEKKEELFELKEGFEKGNMFKNEYKPYKNYTVKKFNIKNNQEELILYIFMLDFAVNDLNLYLDLHPNDNHIYKKFKLYNEQLNKLKKEYVKTYGPLCLSEINGENYTWLDTPFAFEKGGMNNV